MKSVNEVLMKCTALLAGFIFVDGIAQAQSANNQHGDTKALEVKIRTDITSPVLPLRGTIRAEKVTSTTQFIPGQLADVHFGDYVLQNDLLRAVISNPGKTQLTAAGGGNIIDLVSEKRPIDYLNFFNVLGDLESTASAVRYWTAEGPKVLDDTTASIVLHGAVTAKAVNQRTTQEVDVTTTYSLEKNSNRLLISTRLTNNAMQAVSLFPGDVIDWGLANAFVPGTGMLSDLTEKPAPFVLAAADDFSVGYISASSAPLVGLHAPRTSVIQAIPHLTAETTRTVPLQPDAQAVVPTRPGGKQPVFMQPGALPEDKLDVPTWSITPPPAQETRLHAPEVLRSPPQESAYGAPRAIQPPQSSTTSDTAKLWSPYESDDALKFIPGGDGERFAQSTNRNSEVTSPTDSTSVTEQEGRITLSPGEMFMYERFLVVSDSDFSRIARTAYEFKGVTTSALVGVVLESNSDRPIEAAEILISGGPDWDRRSPPAAYSKTLTREDGTYVAHLPVGHYIITPSKVGRISASGQISVEITTGSEPRIVPLLMTPESIVRVSVCEADQPTSIPLPSKITVVSKPGTMPINWGTGPGIARGVGNVFYMPYGAAAIPITPGRYHVTVSRGIEYEAQTGELTVTPGSQIRLDFALKHSLKGMLPNMISMDAGIMTTASSVGTASPTDRVVQAAAEGVQVLVTGDFGVATDLNDEIRQLGLQKYVKAFPGMRVLLERNGLSANLLLYPLTRKLADEINDFLSQSKDLPPDVVLADLRNRFPNVVLQIDSPLDPQVGYLNSFRFDNLKRQFETGDGPPPDFDALQIVDGKKWRMHTATLPQLYELQMARTRDSGAIPLSGLGSSRSRLAIGEEVGYPRVYLYTRSSSLQSFTADDLVRAIRGQHYIATNGPILTLTALNPKTGEYDVIPGEVVDLSTTDVLTVRVNVLAAPWVSFSNFEVLFNGRPIDKTEVMPTTKVIRYPLQANPNSANRRRAIKEDTIVHADAVGMRRSLTPVVSPAPIDLGGEVHPFAWVGPIFVDKNGDGKVVIPKEPPPVFTDELQTTVSEAGSVIQTPVSPPSSSAPIID